MRLVGPAGRASDTRARSRGCTSSSDRAAARVSGIGAGRSPLSTTRTAHAPRAARRVRRSAPPTVPCRRRAGRRRDRAARRRDVARCRLRGTESACRHLSAPAPWPAACRSRHAFPRRRDDRRPDVGPLRDGGRGSRSISSRLLTTLCATKRPPASSARERQVEELQVVALPGVEKDEVERAGELRDLGEGVAGDDADDRRSAGAARCWPWRPARAPASYSMVTSSPPVSRRPRPIQMAE